MPQSLANILVHLVFSTKDRALMIDDLWPDELHGYIGGIIRRCGGDLLAANSMLHHLAPNGSMALLLANGAMSSNSSGEGDIRRALIEALRKYRNRMIESSQVIAEMIQMAKDMQAAMKRHEELGLNHDEEAFYDALAERPEVLLNMGDDTLKKLASELTEKLRNSTTVDCLRASRRGLRHLSKPASAGTGLAVPRQRAGEGADFDPAAFAEIQVSAGRL